MKIEIFYSIIFIAWNFNEYFFNLHSHFIN